jgi:rhamnogalacturonyl hydrolase YesR
MLRKECMKALVVVLSMLAPASAPAANAPARKEALKLAARVADWQLARLDAAHVTHLKEETRDPKSWEQGAFWVGLTRLADVSGERRFRDAILAMGRANQWQLGPRTYHADDHVIGQSYLWAATHGAGPEAIAPLKATFDSILAKPAIVHLSFYVPPSGYGDTACLARWCWCDALFMAPPAWLELGRQTGDRRYVQFALAEFWSSTAFLFDPAENLYFRDSRFFERRDEQGRKLFWSRGNGWVFAGLANMLEALPVDDPNRVGVEKLFRAMAEKLKSIQKPDGYWAPSLLGPENSPAESSGTGFYVYGFAWGVKHRLLDAEEYGPTIRSGWSALTRAVARDGRLGWVQQVGDRPDIVNAADTQFYGVGAFLLAASAVASLTEK